MAFKEPDSRMAGNKANRSSCVMNRFRQKDIASLADANLITLSSKTVDNGTSLIFS